MRLHTHLLPIGGRLLGSASRLSSTARQWAPVLVVACVVGCNESPELTSPAARRLQALSTTYLDYAAARGAGPSSRQQLQAHFQNVPGHILSAAEVSPKEAGAVLISPRDGQPFIIRYGVGLSIGTNVSMIACERSGRDGTRLAAYADGRIALVGDDAAKELMQGEFAKGP